MSITTPPPPPPAPAADPAASTLAAAPAATHAFDLSDPLFAIEHLARLFRLEVDTVRELTYRSDFPQPIKIGRRWLWFPDEVLAWTRKQKRYSTGERKRNAAAPAPEASAEQPAIKPYKPRAKKTGKAAA